MLRLVSATIILCHDGDFARVQLAMLVNFPNAVLNAKRFYTYLNF